LAWPCPRFVAAGEAAGDAVAAGAGDAARLAVGLADGAPDGGMLADWTGAVLPVPLDAAGAPDLELPPVSA